MSSRLAGFVRNREIYNLGMVSGPVLLKTKAKCWIFHTFGVKKKQTKTEKLDEIGQMLVPGALNETKKIRKAGADIFQILELKNCAFIRKRAGCSHVVQRYTVRLCGPR